MSFVCVYILKKTKQKKKTKKNSRFPKFFQKKRKIFKNKKIFGLVTLDFLLIFSKKAHFFSFKDFMIL